MLFIPEAFHSIGDGTGGGTSVAQALSGPAMARYARAAALHRMWVSLGGFPEREVAADGAPLRAFNTHVIIDSAGAVRAAYRKVHLFSVDIPGVRLDEGAYTAPGSELVLVDTPAGRLGLSTCYDVRFPALYGALAAAGAQLIAVPSAFTVPTGAAHWHVLLRARAIEAQAYVVAAAQIGKHNDKRSTYGHALIVDPWGTVVAECGEGASPAIACAEVDLGWLETVRARMPVRSHGRPDVYSSAPRVVGAGDAPLLPAPSPLSPLAEADAASTALAGGGTADP